MKFYKVTVTRVGDISHLDDNTTVFLAENDRKPEQVVFMQEDTLEDIDFSKELDTKSFMDIIKSVDKLIVVNGDKD